MLMERINFGVVPLQVATCSGSMLIYMILLLYRVGLCYAWPVPPRILHLNALIRAPSVELQCIRQSVFRSHEQQLLYALWLHRFYVLKN
jgi:hypothetical protein